MKYETDLIIMLMQSQGKHVRNDTLHLWLTLWQFYYVYYATNATRCKCFYKLLRLITIFYTFRLLFSHFGT